MSILDNRLQSLILNSEIISFDIYDTAIFRELLKPSDVFELIKDKKNICLKEFKKNRILAEKECRKKNKGKEITIDEIYKELSKIYNADLTEFKDEEVRIEKNIVMQNDEIKEVYDYCLKLRKKVIFTSDMYMDINTIIYILNKCSYIKYERIYLSSQLKSRKCDGSIFNIIMEDFKVDANKILHIGDNYNSDMKQPSVKGISTFLYERKLFKKNLFEINYKKDLILDGYLNNRYQNNINEQIGYNVLGPLLYGFSKWLREKELSFIPEKIIFLSRDGYIMKQAYEKLYGKKENFKYVFASRRALIVPTLWEECTVENIQKSINFHDNMKLEEVLERIGLDVHSIQYELKSVNLDGNILIQGSNLVNDRNFNLLFPLIKQKILENSKKEYLNAKSYWAEIIGFSKKVFIVDIGWNGNMQNAIEKLLKFSGLEDIEVYGFYFGVNPYTKHQLNMQGFIYDKEKNYYLKNAIDCFLNVFESFFMTNHGSVKRYITDRDVELYSSEYNCNHGMLVDELKSINLIQESAINFIDEFDSYFEGLKIDLPDEVYFKNILNIGLHPTLEVTELIGDFRFFNSGYTYIARTNNLFLLKNLLESNWKIGYLKRYIKLNLRYDKIIQTLKKLFRRNK